MRASSSASLGLLAISGIIPAGGDAGGAGNAVSLGRVREVYQGPGDGAGLGGVTPLP